MEVPATVRQAIPSFIAYCLYLLDTNIRSATLLGVVGAGGIGFQLLNASPVNQFDVVTYILALIAAVVLVVEALSMWLRPSHRARSPQRTVPQHLGPRGSRHCP